MTTASNDRALLERYAETRDPRVRDALVERFLPLSRGIARRFGGQSVAEEDLHQVAALGLLKAIDRFDPGRGLAFSSFAVPTMAGELRRYMRDYTWTVRPPRALQERALRVRKAAAETTVRRGRAPTAAEVAAELGMPLEDVVESLQTLEARSGVSLDRPAATEDGDGATLGDAVGAEDDSYARVDDAVTIELLLADFSARDREVLRLRFEEDLTQEEIGRRVGISQMHVSRLLRSLLQQLQHAALQDEALLDDALV